MYLFVCCACQNENKGEFPDSNVCDICGWEQDPVQESDPDYRGGANKMSLNEARVASQGGKFNKRGEVVQCG